MRVITRVHNNEDYDIRDHFEIELIDDMSGEQIELVSLDAHPDSPEDNNFERDLSDVFNIQNLIQTAYEAGKNGEDLTFANEEVDW